MSVLHCACLDLFVLTQSLACSLNHYFYLSTMIDYKRQTQLVLWHYVISKHRRREFVINYHFRVKNIYTWISPFYFHLHIASKVIEQTCFCFLFVSRLYTKSARHSRMKWRRLIWTYTVHKLILSKDSIYEISLGILFVLNRKTLFSFCLFFCFIWKIKLIFLKLLYFNPPQQVDIVNEW